jgi:hypothetical protein
MGVTGTVTRNVSCDDFDAVQNHDGTFNSTTLGSYPLALTRLAGWHNSKSPFCFLLPWIWHFPKSDIFRYSPYLPRSLMTDRYEVLELYTGTGTLGTLRRRLGTCIVYAATRCPCWCKERSSICIDCWGFTAIWYRRSSLLPTPLDGHC